MTDKFSRRQSMQHTVAGVAGMAALGASGLARALKSDVQPRPNVLFIAIDHPLRRIGLP